MWVLGVGWYLELDDLVLQTFSAKTGAKLDVLPFFFFFFAKLCGLHYLSYPTKYRTFVPRSESTESQLLDP